MFSSSSHEIDVIYTFELKTCLSMNIYKSVSKGISRSRRLRLMISISVFIPAVCVRIALPAWRSAGPDEHEFLILNRKISFIYEFFSILNRKSKNMFVKSYFVLTEVQIRCHSTKMIYIFFSLYFLHTYFIVYTVSVVRS